MVSAHNSNSLLFLSLNQFWGVFHSHYNFPALHLYLLALFFTESPLFLLCGSLALSPVSPCLGPPLFSSPSLSASLSFRPLPSLPAPPQSPPTRRINRLCRASSRRAPASLSRSPSLFPASHFLPSSALVSFSLAFPPTRPSLSESGDSDLELAAVRHQPEGLEQLQAQTKFTRKELQSLYRGFKNVRLGSWDQGGAED